MGRFRITTLYDSRKKKSWCAASLYQLLQIILGNIQNRRSHKSRCVCPAIFSFYQKSQNNQVKGLEPLLRRGLCPYLFIRRFSMSQIKRLQTIDADTLQSTAYEPLQFIVGDLLPQGLHLLAGAPKIGKSWLALYLCLRVAQGEPLWTFSMRAPTGAGTFFCSSILHWGRPYTDLILER